MSRESQPGDFGGRLREARERRGMSLRQIANATKISVAVLEALERNDVSRLPGGIFGRAFVRSYAVEVGLDPERTIQEFITAFPHDVIVAGHPLVLQAEIQLLAPRRGAAPALFLAAAVAVAAGLTVYFGAFRTLASYAAPLTQRLAAMRAPDLPAIPGPSAARSEPEDSAPNGDAERPPADAAPARTIAATAADDRLTVRLSVSRPCWISAMVDGRKAIERLLQTGEDQTIDVRREIVLTAADAGAVALTLNGAIAKPLGSAGEVVTARLSLANFRDFLSSR
jgi:cytoskeleton protein RodZ